MPKNEGNSIYSGELTEDEQELLDEAASELPPPKMKTIKRVLKENAKPELPKMKLTEAFVKALNKAHWTMDYVKFCELLEVPQNQWAEDKYKQWQDMVLAVNQFDPETLATLFGFSAAMTE